jgi:hypothetical protein
MGDIGVVHPLFGGRGAFLRALTRVEAVRCFFPDISRPVPYSLLLVLGVIAVRWARGHKPRFEAWRVAVPVLGAFFTAVVLSQVVTQPVSVYRYYSFMVFLVVLMGLGLWSLALHLLSYRRAVLFTSYCVPVLLLSLVTYRGLSSVWEGLKGSLHFARGRQSLAEGYAANQVTSGVPVAIRQEIGPKARVYSFNLMCLAMAPDCELETFVSFSLGKDWHEIMFAPPSRARASLQEQGLNYFLIDLDNPNDVYDVLQHAPLFQPGAIEKNFHVCWRRGNVYLLTWPGPNTWPVPKEFYRLYSPDRLRVPYDTRALYQQVRTIYEMNGGKPYPVARDPSLPAVRGWQ